MKTRSEIEDELIRLEKQALKCIELGQAEDDPTKASEWFDCAEDYRATLSSLAWAGLSGKVPNR